MNVYLLLLLLVTYCCLAIDAEAAKQTKQKEKPQQYTVLFIGNSLTAKNNMPLQFERLSKAGNKNVKVWVSTIPAGTFQDHTQSPHTMGLLAARNYTHVVLQEQSFYLSYGLAYAQEVSWPWARILAAAAGNSKVVLYETMGYVNGISTDDSYEAMQQRIIDGYEELRSNLGCETAHAGETWRLAREELTAMNRSSAKILYADIVHPTPEGTFLVAAAMYAQIYAATPKPLSPVLSNGVSRQFSKWAQSWAQEEGPF